MLMNRFGRGAVVLVLLAACALQARQKDALEQGFRNPPDSAKPRVWWHWMNGNITKEGIRLDLEWMKRIGLGGFQNFDASLFTPQVVEKRLVYMTPEWKEAFRYAVTLADQLGLEMAIAGSPGWSETGGPWVPPAEAMKKLVWSSTSIDGGRPFAGILTKPPATTGPFQNIPRTEGFVGSATSPLPEFYADTAVIAYRLPEGDVPFRELKPMITSSSGRFDLEMLTDGDLAKSVSLTAAPAGQKAWIRFEFAQPQTIRGITLATGRAAVLFEEIPPGTEVKRELEAGGDGIQFRTIAEIPGGGAGERTIAFAPVTAKYFQVSFTPPRQRPPSVRTDDSTWDFSELARPEGADYAISELILHTGARVDHFEEKAAFTAEPDLYPFATPSVPMSAAVRKSDVVDLTSRMDSPGKLEWDPPNGRWIVLRMGYSLTGARNSPASPEATGLEVDKLNSAHVKAYMSGYLSPFKQMLGTLIGKRGLQYLITDSFEAGAQNWTEDMIGEFTKRRGYDPRPWMPVLTGCVVESAEASDRFLWDFRRTIADLIAECHYDQISDSLRELGMKRYTESHESGRVFIADGMEVKRNADVPMSAYWTPAKGMETAEYGYRADVRESASVAHIYGQNIVAAESLTARSGAWAWSPEKLKPTADIEMASGLNRFIIHTSVHQPVSDKIPGLSLGPFGQWFTRHETWAEQAQPWITYLARSSFMLQQGSFAADILYFYGEDSNITAIFADKSPDIPAGYNFDYVNADALVNRLSVAGGLISTKSGMTYRLLALDPRSRHMSLPVLRKIRDLVRAGAAVVGPKPAESPSLSDDQSEFQAMAAEVWGEGSGDRVCGKGKVYGKATIGEALKALSLKPDFETASPAQEDPQLLFVHRKLAGSDIYWINNRKDAPQTISAVFRVRDRAAGIWHPDTGAIEPSTCVAGNDGRTTVSLHLDPMDALFVVFQKPAGCLARPLERTEASLATVEGPWEVSFQPNRGAPAKASFGKLNSWSDSADEGIRFFSGTGSYSKRVEARADWFSSGARIWLDLGSVKNIADVYVNGKPLGILWKAPFRVDATDALKPGANILDVKVTNLWVNRLIGDTQPGVSQKYTFTTQQFYRADSPLLPSGLLGPVRIVKVITK
jgi:hypothetical protein